MQRPDGLFVHVFLFECGGCGSPLPSATTADARNPEETDAQSFSLACNVCGWSADAIGTSAKRHWVDTWEFNDSTSKSI